MHAPRVLMTKIGLDGHDRGSRIVATYLRDAGMDVIYTGPWQSVESVVRVAVDEDVDVIGISTLSNDYVLIPALLDALSAAGSATIPVVVGGIVPPEEERSLLEQGIARIFHPGATREDIVECVASLSAVSSTE